MGRHYSNDLRERVAAAVLSGRPCREVVALFSVSPASAVKWSQRLRETGSAGAKRQGRQQPRRLAPHLAWILARLEEEPDLTMRALALELGERGIATSEVSVWRLVRDARLSFKKKLLAAEQDRPDVARKRRLWKKYQARLAPERLVFLDGT